MNEELKGIVTFLTERGKAFLPKNLGMRKLYFIMRYPDKPKLVYAPLECGLLLRVDFLHLLPYHIQYEWDQRKQAITGIELIAVCTVYDCQYDPFGLDNSFIGKSGQFGLAVTVHTQNSYTTILTFYTQFHNGEIKFESPIEKNLELTDLGKRLFPRYL